MDELRALRDDGPTEAELRVAKEHLKGQLMLSLESTSSRMSNLARQELHLGRQQSLAETLRRVEAVSVSQIHRLTRELAGCVRLGLAAVGPVKHLRLRRESLRL